jgi:CRISPR-associated protein Cmr4
MTTQLFIINAQTNLHVGSGDSNYGIIDNLVQRDTLTDLPHIHASSLKGALREYYEEAIKGNAVPIFGSDPSNKEKDKAQKGSHNFFEAHLLAMPIASNVGSFFRATTKERILNMINVVIKMGGTISAEDTAALKLITAMTVTRGKPIVFTEDLDGFSGKVYLGDFDETLKQTKVAYPETILGKRLALFHEDDFKTICNNEHLPVIARNQLENGISQNLWYEQIVPRESRFFMLIQQPNDSTFATDINGKVIQIGANATVGYGYCSFNTL